MTFNKKEQHNFGEIRPRFRLITPFTQEQVLDQLDDAVGKDNTVIGKRVHEVYYLDIPSQNRHYWSPELRVSLEESFAGDGTFIRVVVGPRHSVWLMFVFIYMFLGVCSLFGGLYGLAQWDLGKPTMWIWCFPFMFSLIIGVWVIAKLGQRTGRDQMLHLISVLYHSLGDMPIERK